MSELIDREAVREFIKSYRHSTDVVYHMEKHLYEVPTIDAVPVVHGYWVTETVRGDYVPCCSECGLENGTIYEFNYCPHCGARMDGERREG